MMPVIRISDQTWSRLQKYAKPLVDTPDSVINAALDALEGARGVRKEVPSQLKPAPRRRSGALTPQREFRRPLLRTIAELGGGSPVSQIRPAIERKVLSTLKAGDHDLVSTGEPRWWNAICWERADLVREGLLRDDSPRGTWEFTEKGKAVAKGA